MDLLGVGPLELILVLVIVFLVFGPEDLAATGKKIGRFLSSVRKSEFWKGINQVSGEIRSLPTTLMREAELEDAKNAIEKEFEQVKNMPQEFKMDEFMELKKELAGTDKTASQQDTEPQQPSPEPSPGEEEETNESL